MKSCLEISFFKQIRNPLLDNQTIKGSESDDDMTP